MNKAQTKELLLQKGVAFEESMTLAQLQALVPTSLSSEQVWVLPKRQPRKEHGFRLPLVEVPTALTFAVDQVGKPAVVMSRTNANPGREMVNLALGEERFLMWLDSFQGNLQMEQERLDKAGTGFQVFTELDGNIAIDKSIEFTCNGRYLAVNA